MLLMYFLFVEHFEHSKVEYPPAFSDRARGAEDLAD